MIPARSVVAVVLAAGLGTRFGGGKLRAELDGRPLLQHVLDRLAEAGLGEVIVVLGRDAGEVVAACTWRGERRVVNPRPEAGLAGSLLLAFQALASSGGTPGTHRARSGATSGSGGDGGGSGDGGTRSAGAEAVLILLGDQPRVSGAVIRALLAARTSADRPFAVPRYADAANPNPVLVLRAAWPLIAGLSGDRGLAPLLGAHPERVVEVPAPGANPDVDTRADLARLRRRATGPAG